MYGAEAVILNLSEELNAGGQHTSCLGVFAHAGQPVPVLHERATEAGIRSELLPCRGQMDLAVPKSIRELAVRVGADVVHAHGYKADIYGFLAWRGGAGPATVSTCHTWYDNDLAVRVYGALDRWVLGRFDQVVAVSPEVQERLLRAGVRRDRVHLVRNGIRLGKPLQHVASQRRDHGPLDGLTVGLVGRLAPEKGVDVFLRAAAMLRQEYPAAQFLVAGDGPDRSALQSLLGELGLQNRATLLGQQGDMAALYGSLDLLVSASRQEGLPVALLEGMAAGLPVVATRVGAVPEVVVNEETGLLVEAGDAEALSRAMARLLADGSMRERFGEAGRERVKEQFSAGRMASEYLAIYRDALAMRAKSTPLVRQSNVLP